MPRPKKIPPNLEPEILARYGEGKSSQWIADWLKRDHGIDVTPQAVNQHLQRTRAERADVAKAVVREKLTGTVASDIDILAETQSDLRRVAKKLLKVIDGAGEDTGEDAGESSAAVVAEVAPAYLQTVDRLAKVTDLKLHYSGADAQDEGATASEEARASLLSRLRTLVDRNKKQGET